MIRINDSDEFESADISPELKIFLTKKYTKLIEKYYLCGMSGMFSVILLSENETEYIADKLLEFSEILSFDNTEYIHTVCAFSDGYSEDIYIPYSAENLHTVEKRCL